MKRGVGFETIVKIAIVMFVVVFAMILFNRAYAVGGETLHRHFGWFTELTGITFGQDRSPFSGLSIRESDETLVAEFSRARTKPLEIRMFRGGELIDTYEVDPDDDVDRYEYGLVPADRPLTVYEMRVEVYEDESRDLSRTQSRFFAVFALENLERNTAGENVDAIVEQALAAPDPSRVLRAFWDTIETGNNCDIAIQCGANGIDWKQVKSFLLTSAAAACDADLEDKELDGKFDSDTCRDYRAFIAAGLYCTGTDGFGFIEESSARTARITSSSECTPNAAHGQLGLSMEERTCWSSTPYHRKLTCGDKEVEVRSI